MNSEKKLIRKLVKLYKRIYELKRINVNSNLIYFAILYGLEKNDKFELIPKRNYIGINVIFETSNIIFRNSRNYISVKLAYTYLCENYKDCGAAWQRLFKQQAKDACRRLNRKNK